MYDTIFLTWTGCIFFTPKLSHWCLWWILRWLLQLPFCVVYILSPPFIFRWRASTYDHCFADAIACHDHRLLPLRLSGSNYGPLKLCCHVSLWKLIKVMTAVLRLKQTNTRIKRCITQLLCCLSGCGLVYLNSFLWPGRSHNTPFFPPFAYCCHIFLSLFCTSLKNIGCCHLLGS